jgi:hypothetical protein
MELPFTDGFNQSVSLPAMNRQCTNWYPDFIEDGDAVVKRLFGTPGLSQLATTGSASSDSNRGSQEMAGILYFVNNSALYRLNADFTTTSLGTVSGSGKVSLSNNGIQLLVIVPGGNGFIFDKDTATFTQITDPDFIANGAPQIGMFIDGYFMVSTDTKKFITSNLNDGLAWTATDFGTAESDPDVIVSLVNYKNEAYILGATTVEAQDNVGGTDFPFIRNGLFLDKGVAARFSVVKTSQTFMFIGGGQNEAPAVWSLQGNGVVKMSNNGVDLLLGALTTTELDQVASYAYAQDGSTFVAWELPDETVVYGIDTGKWHKRKSQATDAAGNTLTVGWRATALATAYGILICFDTRDGKVGKVSRDTFDEYGTAIQREFDPSPLRFGTNPIFVPRIEIMMDMGVGDGTTTNPKVRMKKSKDGKVFIGERIRSMGVQGDFGHRAVWHRNGRFPKYAQFRFLMSGPVRPTVIGVKADIVGGA